MAQTVRDIMTPQPIAVPADTALTEAARFMREEGVGELMVTQNGTLCGVVTDRDIVVRAVAEHRDPDNTTAGDVASKELVTVTPDDGLDSVVRLMREHAVRRLPVVEQGHPVGMVSLGDMAMERDERSALADISAEPPNE
jgi:CBS domain-containing protein